MRLRRSRAEIARTGEAVLHEPPKGLRLPWVGWWRRFREDRRINLAGRGVPLRAIFFHLEVRARSEWQIQIFGIDDGRPDQQDHVAIRLGADPVEIFGN